MAGTTTANANAELNALLRATAFTGPAAIYASLHTADPGDTGTSEYTTYTGSRPAITFGAATSKQVASTVQLDYAAMGATTITHMGFWSAASGGTFQDSVALATPATTGANDTLRFVVGAVTRNISG